MGWVKATIKSVVLQRTLYGTKYKVIVDTGNEFIPVELFKNSAKYFEWCVLYGNPSEWTRKVVDVFVSNRKIVDIRQSNSKFETNKIFPKEGFFELNKDVFLKKQHVVRISLEHNRNFYIVFELANGKVYIGPEFKSREMCLEWFKNVWNGN